MSQPTLTAEQQKLSNLWGEFDATANRTVPVDAAVSAANDNRTSQSPLASSLRDAAAAFPDKPGIIFDSRALSYAELDLKAQGLALKLIGSGARPGDRVALHMYNGPELAVSYFACFYAGAIAVPINTRMKAAEVEYVLQHSGTSVYLGQPELYREIEKIRARCPGVRQFVADCRELDVHFEDSMATTLPAVAADQPAAILYTSGTTAQPKGVVHTHQSLLHGARRADLGRGDVAVIITPMVHAAGFALLLATIDAAATAVVIASFAPEVVLDAIERHRGTYLLAMPVMYRALIAAQDAHPRDLRSGKRYLGTGDAVPPALKSQFERCFGRPLHEVFGTTETGLIAANWSSTGHAVGSFGRAVPAVDIDVMDAAGTPASDGIVGEMIVRSASNMVGYWNDRRATEAAVKDGWFHTGDLVRQDSEGYLWFQGRKKEIIIRGGSNISPQEVEAVLYQHGGVRDASVVGLPDAIWGERVVAFVSRRTNQMVTADELIAFVATRLAAYKTPEEIVFLDDLPKSATGKILRRALREAESKLIETPLIPSDSPRQDDGAKDAGRSR